MNTTREDLALIAEAHAKAMEALAADVHPYSGPAVRDWDQQHAEACERVAVELERLGVRDGDLDRAYDQGEDSGNADWVGALADYCQHLTPDKGWTTTSTVRLILEQERELARLRAELERLERDNDRNLDSANRYDTMLSDQERELARLRDGLRAIHDYKATGNLTPFGGQKAIAAYLLGLTDSPWYRDGERALLSASQEDRA